MWNLPRHSQPGIEWRVERIGNNVDPSRNWLAIVELDWSSASKLNSVIWRRRRGSAKNKRTMCLTLSSQPGFTSKVKYNPQYWSHVVWKVPRHPMLLDVSEARVLVLLSSAIASSRQFRFPQSQAFVLLLVGTSSALPPRWWPLSVWVSTMS